MSCTKRSASSPIRSSSKPDERNQAIKASGSLATLAFAACYVAGFTWVRRRLAQRQLKVEPAVALVILGTLLALTAVIFWVFVFTASVARLASASSGSTCVRGSTTMVP